MTNKQELSRELEKAFRRTTVDWEDQVVHDWHKNNSVGDEESEGTLNPKFHIETSSKRWGE